MIDTMDLSSETLGQRLIFSRERAGLSTAQTARRLGVRTRTLSRWERDEVEPRPNRLLTLSQLLNVSPTWLLEGNDKLKPTIKEPGLEDIQAQLKSAKDALSELSDIVEDLTKLVGQKVEESHRDAA